MRLRAFLFLWAFIQLTASTAFSQTIQTVLQPFMERHEIAGAVTCVASKDAILSLDAVGFADLGSKKPMETNDMFWIASMSKPITATALMMLVDEGKVHLDDPVEKYLPEFRGILFSSERDNDHVVMRKPSHPITVREILSHTSGLPFLTALEHPTRDCLPLALAVRSYPMAGLNTEPGTHYAYSNAGINTAGRIIEVVTGMPYNEFSGYAVESCDFWGILHECLNIRRRLWNSANALPPKKTVEHILKHCAGPKGLSVRIAAQAGHGP